MDLGNFDFVVNDTHSANSSYMNGTSNTSLSTVEDLFRKPAFKVLFYCIAVVQTIVTFCGSLLTIVAVYQTPSLRTISNMYVVSLAVADIFIGLIYPYNLFIFLPCFDDVLTTKVSCLLAFFISWLCAPASINSLAFVAMDRYLYIVHPFLYDIYITPRRTKIVIAILWVSSLAIASTTLIWHQWTPTTLCTFNTILDESLAGDIPIGCFVVCFSIMLFCYLSILRVAMRQRRSVAPCGVMAPQYQMVKMLATVSGAYIACWLPITVTFKMSYSDSHALWLMHITYPITCLNSCCNFFIYAYIHSDFRRAFRKILRLG